MEVEFAERFEELTSLLGNKGAGKQHGCVAWFSGSNFQGGTHYFTIGIQLLVIDHSTSVE